MHENETRDQRMGDKMNLERWSGFTDDELDKLEDGLLHEKSEDGWKLLAELRAHRKRYR